MGAEVITNLPHPAVATYNVLEVPSTDQGCDLLSGGQSIIICCIQSAIQTLATPAPTSHFPQMFNSLGIVLLYSSCKGAWGIAQALKIVCAHNLK